LLSFKLLTEALRTAHLFFPPPLRIRANKSTGWKCSNTRRWVSLLVSGLCRSALFLRVRAYRVLSPRHIMFCSTFQINILVQHHLHSVQDEISVF